MKVKVINRSAHKLPEYESAHAAGLDLRANLESAVILEPLKRALIPTGLSIELPPGHEAQIRPRSGLALRKGIGIVNSPGTIDSDYRGEIKIIIINFGKEDFIIQPAERIAQLVLSKVYRAKFTETKELNNTSRGAGGFGHTGR